MTSRATIMREMPSSFEISEGDVLCAKGKKAKEHPGNRLLTALVHSHIKEYAAAATRLEKSFVVSKIVKHINNAGGRFVRNVNGVFFDIGGRNAREKIGQAFRDLLHDQYRSSTRAKAYIRRSRTESTGSDSRNNNNEDEQPATGVSLPGNIANPNAEARPDGSLSLSSLGDIQHFLQPEEDFHINIDDNEPLPVAQSLVEEIDFDSPVLVASAALQPISFGDSMQDMLQRHFTRRASFTASCKSGSDDMPTVAGMSNLERCSTRNEMVLPKLHFNIHKV